MSTCSSCHAPIVWAETTTGKRMPVDQKPDHVNGNVEIIAPDDPALPLQAIVHRQPPMLPKGSLHMSHFATCPFAAEHRKRP